MNIKEIENKFDEKFLIWTGTVDGNLILDGEVRERCDGRKDWLIGDIQGEIKQFYREQMQELLDDFGKWFDGGSGKFNHHIEQYKKEKGLDI